MPTLSGKQILITAALSVFVLLFAFQGIVSAARLARFAKLSFDGADVQFSDNYFNLPAGRIETIECELPELPARA